MGFLECIREKIELDPVIKDGLYSLILFGSYVRGDFFDGVSDLDFFAVLKDGHEEVISRLKPILDECTSHVNRALLDLPWEYLGNLDDPMNKGYPFKFLTFYQEDFLENHTVVYGSDISDILPRYDWRDLVGWRAERLLMNIERDRGRPEMLRIDAGEAIRLIALVNGAKGIGKTEILEVLESLGDDEALAVFTAYVDGNVLEREEQYWVDFIASRMRKILDGV